MVDYITPILTFILGCGMYFVNDKISAGLCLVMGIIGLLMAITLADDLVKTHKRNKLRDDEIRQFINNIKIGSEVHKNHVNHIGWYEVTHSKISGKTSSVIEEIEYYYTYGSFEGTFTTRDNIVVKSTINQ